jgi:alanine racemase
MKMAGRGKSGSYRVVCYFHFGANVFLLTIYAKGAKEDLTPDDKEKIRDLIGDIKRRSLALLKLYPYRQNSEFYAKKTLFCRNRRPARGCHTRGAFEFRHNRLFEYSTTPERRTSQGCRWQFSSRVSISTKSSLVRVARCDHTHFPKRVNPRFAIRSNISYISSAFFRNHDPMRPTRAEINADALRSNLSAIRRHVGRGVRVMAIVKANAYGHGITEVSRVLADEGIDYLGVGFLEEGILLRNAGVVAPILVLGGVLGEQTASFLEHNLEITVSSIELARRINAEAGSAGRKARVHLKIDTGMERIGVRPENAMAFVRETASLPGIDLVGIYSHLATADEKDKSFAREQLQKFSGLIRTVEAAGIRIPLKHIANSGAILDIPEARFDMVRAGMMLYGVYPSRETSESVPVKPTLSLKSKVVFLKEVPAGKSIGYGRTYVTKKPTRIATIPVGYGDGYSRMLSHKVEVLIRGKRYPGVGTVCMDQMMVDVGNDTSVHVGDDVTLIGRDGNDEITPWDIAGKIGTNQYEVLCMIAARVPRVLV